MIGKIISTKVLLDDATLSKLRPDIYIEEVKSGDDVITYEDVITPTEHTYTTIERTQTGTRTVYDSSTETFGWSNVQYKSYEIINEPSNNGRKMYVAHLTAQLSDGTTHELEYRLTFPPTYLNRYNLSGGNVWLQDKTNWIVPIYVELFDKTDNKTLQGDIEITIKDLDNAGGNFGGIWEGISLANGTSFVRANYGTPKKHSWHNQEWYSGNNNNPGVVGGDITIKVPLRDHFTHAFDYVLVNGDGYSAGFGVQDIDLANMTKVTTTSHEVPVFEDREVTHTETIDVHSTVEHITPAPILKYGEKLNKHVIMDIYKNDCSRCKNYLREEFTWDKTGWRLNDDSIVWGDYLPSSEHIAGMTNIPWLDKYDQLEKVEYTCPIESIEVNYPNTDYIDHYDTYSFTNVVYKTTDTTLHNDGAYYIYTAPFKADLEGVQHSLELRIRVPENKNQPHGARDGSPRIEGGHLWYSIKLSTDCLYEMCIYDNTTNEYVHGNIKYNLVDLDNKDGNFSGVWEGVKPTSNTKLVSSSTGYRTKSGYYSGVRSSSGGNGGTVTFETKLLPNGYTPAFNYKVTSPDGSYWWMILGFSHFILDQFSRAVERVTEDHIHMFINESCDKCSCTSGYQRKPKDDELHFYRSEKVLVTDCLCGVNKHQCRYVKHNRFSSNECYNIDIDKCYMEYSFDYYNKEEMIELIYGWLMNNQENIKSFLNTYIWNDLSECGKNLTGLKTANKTILGSIHEIYLGLGNKVDSLNMKYLSRMDYNLSHKLGG